MPLTLDSVSYTYAAGMPFAQAALRGVSVEVSPGDLVLLVGATGSGKSTLLRIAAGLLTADSGTATIDGEPLAAGSARGAVGLVFQNPESQLFAETVLADVAFGPRNLGASDDDADAAAAQAIASVGLDPEVFGPRSPFGLSGGEARRIAIAGVLAMRPRYLLLDEPTAGLDARGRAAVMEVLGEVRRTTGVIVVTHDAEEFLDAADRVLVLTEGRTAFSGTAAELLGDPTPLVAAGVGLPPLLDVQMRARDCGVALGRLEATPAKAAEGVASALLGGPR